MAKFSGQVQFINQKEFNGKILHSFKLAGGQGYYNCGTSQPPIQKGEQIHFEGEQLPTGNVQVNVATIETNKGVGKAEVVRGSAKSSFARATTSNPKEKYWENREARDMTTQQTIQLQASRNSAIAMASLILQAGAVAGFAKAKPADQMDILTSLVDHLTERYQEQVRVSKEPKKVAYVEESESLPDPSVADVADGDEWS